MILTESGFAQAIVKEMRTTGYEHPYWQEWKNRTVKKKLILSLLICYKGSGSKRSLHCFLLLKEFLGYYDKI